MNIHVSCKRNHFIKQIIGKLESRFTSTVSLSISIAILSQIYFQVNTNQTSHQDLTKKNQKHIVYFNGWNSSAMINEILKSVFTSGSSNSVNFYLSSGDKLGFILL